MEEKILIKSERYNVKKFFKAICIIGGILFSVRLIIPANSFDALYSYFGVVFVVVIVLTGLPLPLFALGGLIYLWLHSYELTVTDKRIYGKVAFGKRVDLPVDSISAISTVRLFKGVSVSTASGKISFLVIKNADEIYTVMNNLLIERQQEKNGVTTAPVENETDKLKKYKDLLDSGVITQEEFDAKKKQLLGL